MFCALACDPSTLSRKDLASIIIIRGQIILSGCSDLKNFVLIKKVKVFCFEKSCSVLKISVLIKKILFCFENFCSVLVGSRWFFSCWEGTTAFGRVTVIPSGGKRWDWEWKDSHRNPGLNDILRIFPFSLRVCFLCVRHNKSLFFINFASRLVRLMAGD